MSIETVKRQVREIIKNRLDLVIEGPEPDDSGNLFEDWGIDSVDVIDLVLAIEQQFGVKIKQTDDDVSKHFENINTLSEHIYNNMPAEVD